MNRSQINDWLALIANLAVVGGIVFLAIEIRQNNELLRSESRQTLVSNDVTSLSANIGNADVFAKMASGQDLSMEEQLRLSGCNDWIMIYRKHKWSFALHCWGLAGSRWVKAALQWNPAEDPGQTRRSSNDALDRFFCRMHP